MARRPIPEEDDVSLFPFLSIVASIIGVLTLMIASVTLGQMNQGDAKEVVANAQEMQRIQNELAESEDVIKELSVKLNSDQAKLLKESGDRRDELVKSRAELDTLLKELAAARTKAEEQQKVKIVIPEIPEGQRETVADMQAQLGSIKERLAVLTKDLNAKKTTVEADVSVLPSGTGLNIKPSFIECQKEAIVLHTEEEPLLIRTAEAVANPKFVALLQKVANGRNETIIFLVRSDGLGTFRAVKAVCDAQEVRNGKLPVVGQGRLDLSHFRKQEGAPK
jgi:hypothetical protein